MKALIANNLVDLTSEEIEKGLKVIPMYKLHVLIQRVVEELLPKIEAAKGREHVDYKFMNDIGNAIAHCINTMDGMESLQRKVGQLSIERDIYRDNAFYYEKRLLKYETAQEILLGQTYDDLKRFVLKSNNLRIEAG